jgi:hypothetical protein
VHVNPSLALEGVERRPFAVGGYFPAGAGKTYWFVRVRLMAGSDPLAVTGGGPDVVLAAGEGRYEALGLRMRRSAVVPRPAVREPMKLQPETATDAVFVFEVPTALKEARLIVANAGQVDVQVAPVEAVPADKLAGAFRELPPRNLKPLLADPVMAALQGVQHRLVVRKGRAGVRLQFPEAGVRGQARPARGGLFDVSLSAEGKTLQGKLRLLADGDMIILYLQDEPMHQITYWRQGVKLPADRRAAAGLSAGEVLGGAGEDQPAPKARRSRPKRPRRKTPKKVEPPKFFGI